MIILASQSPRRAALLDQVGITYECLAADVDESVHADERAADYVERVAIAKADTVHAQHPNRIVLAADTAVVLDQRILGKPRDRDEAVEMLSLLSGRTHEVLTGVAIAADVSAFRLSVSRVGFRTLSADEIDAYWRSGEPADKAGAYAVQGIAAAFIERIEGSYSGIMGLPLFETLALLREAGVQTRSGI
ncbi:MAG: septum formation inhibitor Maf [Gammaproteobacteria bacterium]|nr:septum formation inhibitor Maf [Gammaproteobacteria bacterium]